MIVLIIIAITVVSLLVAFFIFKGRYIAQLRRRRDEIDFDTPEGKWLIRGYNRKIDELNGFKLFN